MQRRHGVRRRITNTRFVVEHHRTVAHAWRRARIGDATREWKLALRNHLRESIKDRQIGALKLAWLTTGDTRAFAGQDRNDAILEPHWDSEHLRRSRLALDRDLALLYLAAGHRRREQRQFVSAGPSAHPVAEIDGLARRWPNMCGDEPAAFAGRHVKQEIGEAQVGEQTPLGDEVLQMCCFVSRQCGVLSREFGKGRHDSPVRILRMGLSCGSVVRSSDRHL